MIIISPFLFFMKTTIYSFFLFLFPMLVSADVVINEVAWMGTVVSANDEWVELYNTENEVMALDGWTLSTEDGAMNILLSGSVAGGGYVLIERTDDTTIPTITADVVAPFGSGFSNSGEILVLKNSSGNAVDRIDASSGWPAGDNASKETMQKSTLQAGGWVTAAATPKAVNAGNSEKDNDGNTPSSNTNNNQAGGGDAPYVPPEQRPHITADAGVDKQAAVGEEIPFRGLAWGLENELLDTARYIWNFGDGVMQEGQNAGHAYMFPGTYMVRLIVSSGKYSAFDDTRITVNKNKVFVSEVLPGASGWIEFENEGKQPIHIGGWIVETTAHRFIIPANTTIAAESLAVLSAKTTHLTLKETGDHAYLFYPDGSYATGISYVFQAPTGKSISHDKGISVFTEPTPGEKNHIEARFSSKEAPAVAEAVVETALAKPQKHMTQLQEKEEVSFAKTDATFPADESVTPADTHPQEKAASLAGSPALSKKYRETLWFGGSLVLGGLAAVVVVLWRRKKQKDNNSNV